MFPDDVGFKVEARDSQLTDSGRFVTPFSVCAFALRPPSADARRMHSGTKTRFPGLGA